MSGGRVKTTQISPLAITTSTVAQTSVQIVGQNLSRRGLYIFNPTSTHTLWIAPGSTVAAANGAGCVAVQPLQGISFVDPPFINSVNAVYDAATSAVTVWEYYE